MLHKNASAQTLGLARAVIFSIWLWDLLTHQLADLALIPFSLFDRLGPLRIFRPRFFEWLLNDTPLTVLQLIVLVLLVPCILGIKPYRLWAIAACVGLTVYCALIEGYSNISHRRIPPLLAAYLLALFPAADGFSFSNGKQRKSMYPAAMVSITAMIAGTYVIIAAHRISRADIDLYTGDSILYWLGLYSSNFAGGNHYGLLVIGNEWSRMLVKIGFAATTIFEILTPLCLFSRTFRWAWLSVIVPFHFLSHYTMNIFFWQNVVMIPIFFTGIFSPRPGTGRVPILFYDGECSLCDRSVQWLLKHDPEGIFRFAPLQGLTAKSMLPEEDRSDLASMVVVDEAGIHRRSTAVLRAVSRLGGICGAAGALLLIPPPIRDAAYRFVAANRFRWFGRADSCRLPSESEKQRMLV